MMTTLVLAALVAFAVLVVVGLAALAAWGTLSLARHPGTNVESA
jgi:hypothetical protein